MGKILLTCVLALVFGFGGAAGAIASFHGQLEGPQGQTGLTGATGVEGPAGADGIDGADGADGGRGAAGKAGKAGKKAAAAAKAATDLGVRRCAGSSVRVLTDVNITKAQRLQLTKQNVCVVGRAGQ